MSVYVHVIAVLLRQTQIDTTEGWSCRTDRSKLSDTKQVYSNLFETAK